MIRIADSVGAPHGVNPPHGVGPRRSVSAPHGIGAPHRALPLALGLALLVCAAPVVRAAGALPDTGLFAPVAKQYRARLARLETPGDAAGPARVRALLGVGRVAEACSLVAAHKEDDRAWALARAEALLARNGFLAAALVRSLDRAGATGEERRVWFMALFGTDDAAHVDSATRALALGPDTEASGPHLLAAGRLACDMLDYARAESCFMRVVERTQPVVGQPSDRMRDRQPAEIDAESAHSAALTGLSLVLQKRRDFDGALARLEEALRYEATADALEALAETLIRLGRTDEAISAAEWAVTLNPFHEAAHYLLGNGYARKNYTQLRAAQPRAFANAAGRRALARADALLARGARAGARRAYEGVARQHPGWADARVRLASLDFEEGEYARALDRARGALRLCPEYGRAHAVLAKALEARRFEVDVHRADYERRFAATPMPQVPGIEKFVLNWKSLSPRHQRRIALSVAPWKTFLPVLVEGGATYYIKPLHLLLSECPGQETLHDQRISYDSRLWDDVRGCGGYHTVTGVEDVERTIFDRYDTVLHELAHQVHGVLPADDARAIEEHYRHAKQRDDATKDGFLSRYAGGSVHEYLAEGANALYSPKRDAYDPREVVRERLDAIDPALRSLVEGFLARADVSASYPVAYVNAGDDRVERGRVDEAVRFYEKALGRNPSEESALASLVNALVLGGRGAAAESAAGRAVRLRPASGPVCVAAAGAAWHGGRGLEAAIRSLEAARAGVRAEDLPALDRALGSLAWTKGDTALALAAFDSALVRQFDDPDALRGRAAALALAGRWDEAFTFYDRAVRLRTGVVDLRCEYARDLLRAGRLDAARAQLDAARLLDEENPDAEALRGWADLAAGAADFAKAHADRALAWGPWSDLARIVLGGAESRRGRADAARAAWAPVEERIARGAPPGYVYRTQLATWEQVHALPAVERELLREWAGR
jgi:tetratricopeptide (TPR) repeat protein